MELQYSINTESERLEAFATLCWYYHDRCSIQHSAPHSVLCEGRFWAGN